MALQQGSTTVIGGNPGQHVPLKASYIVASCEYYEYGGHSAQNSSHTSIQVVRIPYIFITLRVEAYLIMKVITEQNQVH